jgi:glycine cleavage system H protein
LRIEKIRALETSLYKTLGVQYKLIALGESRFAVCPQVRSCFGADQDEDAIQRGALAELQRKGDRMEFPEDLKYSREHEWAKLEGDGILVGITDYAQERLGEIVYVELPEEGSQVAFAEAFGVVESTKAVSDLYAPVSGTVVEVNDTLLDNPELINEDPYEDGWLIRIAMSDQKELGKLMDAAQYASFVEEERKKEEE